MQLREIAQGKPCKSQVNNKEQNTRSFADVQHKD